MFAANENASGRSENRADTHAQVSQADSLRNTLL
jgi:hypothetical protein